MEQKLKELESIIAMQAKGILTLKNCLMALATTMEESHKLNQETYDILEGIIKIMKEQKSCI